MDKQPLRHILNSQPSSEHRVSSKVLSIEGYYSINIFTRGALLSISAGYPIMVLGLPWDFMGSHWARQLKFSPEIHLY